MNELEAAVALLAAHADRDVVVNLLKTKAGAIHHEIHQDGYNGGYGKKAGELNTATARASELEGKLTKADADLVEARNKTPDLAKVHADYQGQITALNAQHTAALTEATGKVKAKEKTRAQSELEAHLIRLGVRPVMARVEAKDNADRLVPDDAGEIQVLQPGLAIPYNAAGERTPIMLLAEAIRAKVPADMIVSGADGGSGSQTGAGGPALTGQARLVADIQAKAEADRKVRAEKNQAAGAGGLPPELSRLAVRSS